MSSEKLDFIINCGNNTAWDWARRWRKAMSKKHPPQSPLIMGGLRGVLIASYPHRLIEKILELEKPLPFFLVAVDVA